MTAAASTFIPPTLLKWAGGKSWLLPTFQKVLPLEVLTTTRYVEPFLGGTSVFRWFENRRRELGISAGPLNGPIFLLGDLNPRMITTYRTIAADGSGRVQAGYDRGRQTFAGTDDVGREILYYSWRDQLNKGSDLGPVDMAVLTLLLNRSCFNGVYRENSKGEVNIAFGKMKTLPDLAKSLTDFRGASARADFRCASWEWLQQLPWGPGHFLYLDPPYSGMFCGYGKKIWTHADDVLLAQTVRVLALRGV